MAVALESGPKFLEVRPVYRSPAVGALVPVVLTAAATAAPFQNLNFNEVNPPGAGPVLPHWTASTPQVGYEFVCLGSACVTVVDSSAGDGHAVYLQGGLDEGGVGDGISYAGVSLSQVGQVPAGARSLRLVSTAPVFRPPPPDTLVSYENLRISLAGRPLALVVLETIERPFNDSLVTLGANLPPDLQGKPTQLQIATVTPTDSLPEPWAEVDLVEFSPFAVPEPGALMVAGFFLMGAAARGRGRSGG